MKTKDIRVGDRIRVTYVNEGVVDSVDVSGHIRFGDYFLGREEETEPEVTVEILERAKPKWQDGDVAQLGGNPVYTRFAVRGQWIDAYGTVHFKRLDDAGFEYKLIMRDGKPV